MEELISVLDEQLKNSSFLRRQFTKEHQLTAKNGKQALRIYKGSCFVVSFIFSANSAPGVRNLLECQIATHKESLLLIPLSRLIGYLEKTYIHTDYPFVATTEQMEKAVLELLALLEAYTPKITDFFCNAAEKERFFRELIGEIHRDCGEEIFLYQNGHCFPKEDYDPRYLVKMLSLWYSMRKASRLTKPFCLFFKDDPYGAVEGLAGYGQKDGELARLCDLPLEDIHFSPLQKELYLLSRRPNRLAVLPFLVLSMLFCSLVAGPVLSGICYLFYLLGADGFAKELLYNTSLGGDQFAFLILPFAIAGVLWLCFDVKPLYRLLYPKKIYKAYATALSSNLEKRLTGIVGSLILSFLLVFSFLQGHQGVAFYETRFMDNTAFFQMEGSPALYENIKEAAYVKARPVGLQKEDSPYASVILVLKDGRHLDLYSYTTDEETTRQILPLLLEKEVPVVEYDCIADFHAAHPQEDAK